MDSHLTDISRVIQLAVAPVFLLTAIATMINALNVRLGRIVDRRRVVQERADRQAAAGAAGDEIRMLKRRSAVAEGNQSLTSSGEQRDPERSEPPLPIVHCAIQNGAERLF